VCLFFVPQDAKVQQSLFTAQGAALLRRCPWVISPAGYRTCCPEPERIVASASSVDFAIAEAEVSPDAGAKAFRRKAMARMSIGCTGQRLIKRDS